jgi:HSP20 family protein
MTSASYTWDPFREMASLFDNLDRAVSTAGDTPGINVLADDDAVVVTSELPGAKADDVQIDLQDNVLTISAQRRLEADDDTWLTRERSNIRFSRSVQLPFQVDEQQVEARLRDGVLRVALKRAAADKPRRIAITAN